MQLRKWLSLHGLHNLPIESLVVISSPRTIIKTSDKILLSKVIHSANLPNRIKQIKNQYKEKSLGNINGLIDQIMNEHSPQRQNILAQYKIIKVELLKGVQCEECFTMAMLKEKQGWRCSNCNSVSKHAHLRALQDYTLLFEMITTNSKLKDFLNMQSSSAVKRLLQTMNIPHTGENKGRIYDLTFSPMYNFAIMNKYLHEGELKEKMKSFNIDHYIASVLQWILNIALIILSIVLSIFLINETITFVQYIFSAKKYTSYKLVESIIVYFLYFEFIALIIKYFKSNYHFPLRYFIYIGITALIRLIIVSHEEPMETLLYAGSILVLVISLYISNMRDLRKE